MIHGLHIVFRGLLTAAVAVADEVVQPGPGRRLDSFTCVLAPDTGLEEAAAVWSPSSPRTPNRVTPTTCIFGNTTAPPGGCSGGNHRSRQEFASRYRRLRSAVRASAGAEFTDRFGLSAGTV